MRLPVTIHDPLTALIKVAAGRILIMVHLKGRWDSIAEQSADVSTHRAQLRHLPIVAFLSDGVCIELLTPDQFVFRSCFRRRQN